jgi:putative tryptophan/tyrosine transport system substrate-binding protein
MIDRRTFLILALGAAPGLAAAQARPSRVGWLVFGAPPLGPLEQMLINSMAKRGLVAGRNIEFDFRYANGVTARLPALATELAAAKPDLLVGLGGDVVFALHAASGGIPIVGGVSDNPVRAGLAESFARPGGNFTGVAFLTDEMAAKRLELLKEAAPAIKRVGAIWNPQHLDDEMVVARRAAGTLDIVLTSHEVNDMAGVDAALRDALASRAEGLFVIPSRLMVIASGRIATFARENGLPAVSAWREFAASGLLLTYGPDRIEQTQLLAGYAERVLGGARPSDLPIAQPTKFEMVVNLKTAKALGITIPNTVLVRADEVIE